MAIRNRSGRGPPTAWIGCADVEGNTFHAGLPQRWAPQGIMATRGAQRPYDVHPDGRRIVMKRPPEMEAPRDSVVMVFDFFEELRHAVAPK
jgi:hypothetical protein